MTNKLLVVTDLGSFKAYKLEANNLHSTPRLELIEEFDLTSAHGKMVNQVSDLAGRYHTPTMGKWSTTWGERHNIELERKRRLIKQVAAALTDLLRRDGAEVCYLAASKEINHQIIAELPREARAKIEKIVPCDLTKAEKSDLLKHFEVLKPKLPEIPLWQNHQPGQRAPRQQI